MEFLRKHSYDTQSLLVFVGFLLSSSAICQYPVLHSDYFGSFESSYFLILIIICFVASFVSTLAYLSSRGGIFCLQIIEYILYPIASWLLVAIVSVEASRNEASGFLIFRTELSGVLPAFLLVFVMMVLQFLKIVFVNQLFISNQNLEICRLRIRVRLARTLKIFVYSLVFPSFGPSISIYVFGTLNILEMGLILYDFTYANIHIEYALMVASLNNALSVFSLSWNYGTGSANIFYAGELFTVIVYFARSQIVSELLELKYSCYIEKFRYKKLKALTEIQKTIVFECFRKVLFEGASAQQSASEEASNWSPQFQQLLKVQYTYYIYSTMLKIVKQTHEFVPPSKSSVVEEILRLYKSYKQMDGEPTMRDIFNDRLIFYDLLCSYFSEGENQATAHKNRVSEYMVSMGLNLDRRFIIKSLVYLCKQSNKNLNYFVRIKNLKIKNFIKAYIDYHEMGPGRSRFLMTFEEEMKKIREDLIDICATEVTFMDSLVNFDKNYEKIENCLITRNQDKQKLEGKLDAILNSQEYLYFHQFVYLYLTFEIVFCKFVQGSFEKIYEKFIAPRANAHKFKYGISEKSCLLCEGLFSENRQVGEVVLSNNQFRREFLLSSQTYEELQISKLIPPQQRAKHYSLMRSNEAIGLKEIRHGTYECFIKTNLNTEAFNIYGSYSIQISIFNCAGNSILYFCDFQKTHKGFFVEKIQIKSPELKQQQFSNQSITEIGEGAESCCIEAQQSRCVDQLGCPFSLVPVNEELLEELDGKPIESLTVVGSNQTFANFEGSRYRAITEGQKKQKIMEKRIWEKNLDFWHDVRKIGIFYLIVVLLIIAMFVILQMAADTNSVMDKMMTESYEYIENLQNGQNRVGLFLMILRAVDSEVIPSNMCEDFGIKDLGAYSRQSLSVLQNENFMNFFNDLYLADYSQKQKVFFMQFFVNFYATVPDSAQIRLNYVDYVTFLKQMTAEYLQIDLTRLQDDGASADLQFKDKRAFESQKLRERINKFTYPNQMENSNVFFYKIVDEIEKRIVSEIENTSNLEIISLCLIMLLLALMVSFFLMAYQRIYIYIKLITEVDKLEILYRKNEISALQKELRRIRSKQFVDIDFSLDGDINIAYQEVTKLSWQSYRIQNFNKNQEAEAHVNKRRQLYKKRVDAQSSRANEKKIGLLQMLSIKRKFFLMVLALCMLVCCSCIAFYELLSIRLAQKKVRYGLTAELEKSKQSLLVMLSSNWIEHQHPHYGYRSSQLNNFVFKQALNQSKSVDLMKQYDVFDDSTALQSTLYQSLCRNIENRLDSSQCEKDVSVITQQKLVQVLPSFSLAQEMTFMLLSQQMEAGPSLCQDFKIYFEYIEPVINRVQKVVNQQEIVENNRIIDILESIYYVLITIVFLFVGYFSLKFFLFLLYTVKFEVMTLNTVEDLCKINIYQPHLNRLLNPEE